LPNGEPPFRSSTQQPSATADLPRGPRIQLRKQDSSRNAPDSRRRLIHQPLTTTLRLPRSMNKRRKSLKKRPRTPVMPTERARMRRSKLSTQLSKRKLRLRKKLPRLKSK